MSACNFSIPFNGDTQALLNKAKTAITGQGGTFTGDQSVGEFFVSVFGNSIKGSYTIEGQNLIMRIDSKPFFVPCSTIESFLKKQLGS